MWLGAARCTHAAARCCSVRSLVLLLLLLLLRFLLVQLAQELFQPRSLEASVGSTAAAANGGAAFFAACSEPWTVAAAAAAALRCHLSCCRCQKRAQMAQQLRSAAATRLLKTRRS